MRCNLLGKIVETNPNIAEVHFQIGRIFYNADRYDRAVTHFQAAATLKPNVGDIWAGWAVLLPFRAMQQGEKAFLAALKAAPIAPELRVALQNRFGAGRSVSKPKLGGADPKIIAGLVALMNAGRFPDAEMQAGALFRKHPASAIAANILASAFAAQGKAIPADQCLSCRPEDRPVSMPKRITILAAC